MAPGQANSKAASLVRNSVEMAKLSENGWRGKEMEAVMEALGKDIGENPAVVRDQLKVNAGEAARVAVSLGIPQVTALMPSSQSDTGRGAAHAPEVDPVLQLQILRDLTHSLTDKPDINEVCQLVIEGIHRAVGMQRVVLLMSDRSGLELIPRKLGARVPKAGKTVSPSVRMEPVRWARCCPMPVVTSTSPNQGRRPSPTIAGWAMCRHWSAL